jgi:hypothetical protein
MAASMVLEGLGFVAATVLLRPIVAQSGSGAKRGYAKRWSDAMV